LPHLVQPSTPRPWYAHIGYDQCLTIQPDYLAKLDGDLEFGQISLLNAFESIQRSGWA
jgi:hypothetical protein